MVLLEFIGKPSPRRDLNAYRDALKAKYPTLSETGIQEVTRAELERTPPRYPGYVLHLFGEDVAAEDVTTMAVWPLVSRFERRRLRSLPIEKRLALIDPAGLSRTYVWRKDGDWVQEVSEADVAVIRGSPARMWFRNVERLGRWTGERAWDLPVVETHPMTSWGDVDAFRREQDRKDRWNGVLLPSR